MNKFDKPYRTLQTYDIKKNLELFNIVNNLDTNELLMYSLNNQVSLNVTNENGDCLIHEVIKINKHKASEHIKLNIIRFLIQNGSNPDTPNKINITPLHLACQLQFSLIIKYLIVDMKVEPNYIDNIGYYPFHYLFLGEIITNNTNDINDIISNKKLDPTNTEGLIDIKKKIWEEIKDEKLLKTITATIDLLISDDNNKNNDKRRNIIHSLIEKYKLDIYKSKLSDIISNIKSLNNGIITNIKQKFYNFKKLDCISIHKTTSDSWNPNELDKNSDYSLINKNGDYKQYIKKEIKMHIKEIKDLIDDYKYPKEIHYNNESYDNKYKYKYKKRDIQAYILTFYEKIELENNNKQSHGIYNNNSSLINFKGKKYLGGTNTIYVLHNNIMEEFKYLISDCYNDDLKLLYLLCGSDKIDITIIEYFKKIYDKNDINMSNIYIKYYLNKIIDKCKIIGINIINACIMIMSYIEIKYQIIFTEKILESLNILNDNKYYIVFIERWYKKIIDINKDEKESLKHLLIYEMYVDYYRIFDKKTPFPFRIIALITGFANNTEYIIKSVYNIYIPHIIYLQEFCDDRTRKIYGLLLLLNDDINMVDTFYEDIVINKYYEKIDNMKLLDNIKCIAKLFSRYLEHDYSEDFIKKCDENEINYYNKFKDFTNKQKPIYIFKSIIIKINNKKLDGYIFDDFLYLLNDDIKNISIYHFINDLENKTITDITNKIKLSDNIQPSYEGYYNLILDDISNYIQFKSYKDNYFIHHFVISHLMGLYYTGTICEINKDSLNSIYPLSFVNNNESLNIYYKLYGFYNNNNNLKIRPPTTNNIKYTIDFKNNNYIKKIHLYLYEVRDIIDALSNGISTNINRLFTILYPTIKFLLNSSNIIDKFPINKLQNSLNHLNKLYYIYYYLNNSVKIGKFNYYLLTDQTATNKNYIEEEYYSNTKLQQLGGSLYHREIIDRLGVDYTIDRDKAFPPSIYDDMEIIYKYGLIELIKSKLNNQTFIENTILEGYIKLLKIENKGEKIYKYLIIAQIIEDLVKRYLENYISNRVINSISDINLILSVKEFNVSLNMPLKFENKHNLNIKNIYSIIQDPLTSKKPIILYPNDFTNLSKFKIKYNFYINEDIIEILLNNNSLLFVTNLENNSPIYFLLKYNNLKIIEALHFKLIQLQFENNYLITNYKKDGSLAFIIQEYNNNLNKILINFNKEDDNINKLLKNIDSYLYGDIYALISNNENFGNNIILYLEDSFNICSYLTLQYLCEHLNNIDTEFTKFNRENLFILMNTDMVNNKNYMNKQFYKYNIHKDIDIFIANEIKIKKEEERRNLIKEIEKMEKYIRDGKIYNTYKPLFESKQKLLELNKIISNLRYIIDNDKNYIIDDSNIDPKIIKRYDSLGHNYNIAYAWSKLLNSPIKENQNLLLIKILLYLHENINENEENKNNINIINKGLKHLHTLCEGYFNDKSLLDTNKVLRFIKDLLEYLTKLVICNGIEYSMRHILFTFYTSSSDEESSYAIYDKINYIFSGVIEGFNDTLHDILFNNICERLVKCSTSIYKDKDDKILYQNETIRDILLEFFNYLDLSLDEIKQIFELQLIPYFDNFISKTILLWMVNIENIFKYFINTFRITGIYIILSNKYIDENNTTSDIPEYGETNNQMEIDIDIKIVKEFNIYDIKLQNILKTYDKHLVYKYLLFKNINILNINNTICFYPDEIKKIKTIHQLIERLDSIIKEDKNIQELFQSSYEYTNIHPKDRLEILTKGLELMINLQQFKDTCIIYTNLELLQKLSNILKFYNYQNDTKKDEECDEYFKKEKSDTASKSEEDKLKKKENKDKKEMTQIAKDNMDNEFNTANQKEYYIRDFDNGCLLSE